MAQNSMTGGPGHKHQWFARRQVYLRAGQDSQYIELSPALQIGVALGFGAFALWLIGTTYGAVSSYLDADDKAAALAELRIVEQALGVAERERDAAVDDAALQISLLETELAGAQAAVTEAAESSTTGTDESLALTAELEQTKEQLDDLHLRLSESKADHAALQARFEAEVSATSNASEKTAEEAASLHGQLEEAFNEIEGLQKERDAASAKLAAANEESSAKDEEAERNAALLKAATAEIERLQESLASAGSEAEERTNRQQASIAKLEEQLGEVVAARDELESKVSDLNAELEAVGTAGSVVSRTTTATDVDAQAAVNAAVHAQSITAGLKEADLLATIDDLRAELAADIVSSDANDRPAEESDEVASLRQRLTTAEAEIELLILSGLKANDEPAPAPAEAVSDAEAVNNDAEAVKESDESEHLRSELLAAKADIIKLNADVKAAKQRLAAKAENENENGQTSKPDNSAKLEQQLASTRTRVQQLNKALADAKLREVAIDLALINVVPSPSPPAPR